MLAKKKRGLKILKKTPNNVLLPGFNLVKMICQLG